MQADSTTARRERLATVLACALLALAPLESFALHNDYPLTRPEMMLAALAVVAIGGATGALFGVLGGFGRALGIALFATLFVDFQTDWLAAGRSTAWAVPIALLAVCVALRRHVAAIAASFAVAAALTALLTPAGSATTDVRRELAPRSDAPPFIHLILDEHIGLAGVPEAFDRDGAVRRRIGEVFAGRGFTLYGHAFSRYPVTNTSLSHLVNFSASPRAFQFTEGSERVRVTRNAYFEEMTRRGAAIHVYQTDYMDFCSASGEIAIARCFTHPLETIAAIDGAPLPLGEKLRLVLGMWSRLSRIATAVRTGLVLAGFPSFAGGERVSSVSAMKALPAIEEGLAAARPGELHFAHVALPHYPYAYDRACRLRPDARQWLSAHDVAAFPLSNTTASRAARYPLYLDQLRCTLDRVDALLERLEREGVFERATIVVHGDHGSRLQIVPPRLGLPEPMSRRDWVDAYSTLLAVRRPGDEPGRTDTAMRGIDEALEQLVRDGAVASTPAERAPTVFAGPGLARREPRPLPPF